MNVGSVLTAYGNAVKTLASPTQLVIDIQNPLRAWAKVKRKTNPSFAWTAEGVHPNAEGHQIMADAIYAGLFLPVAGLVSQQATIPGLPRSEYRLLRSSQVRYLSIKAQFLINGTRSKANR